MLAGAFAGTESSGATVGAERTAWAEGAGADPLLRKAAQALASAEAAAMADFKRRCAEPGVIRCVGFDDRTQIRGRYGQSSGITKGAAEPVIDPMVKGSGTGSLKFTIPSRAPADTSGSYFTNFSDDLTVQFGPSSEFFIQWRQRFSRELLATRYAGGGGFKSLIVATGDQPGRPYSSCTALTVAVSNYQQRGFPFLYNSCTGSSSHGPSDPFFEHLGNDFKLQNARPRPYCLYSQQRTSYFPPSGNCFGYFPDEWMTFQLGIRTGPRLKDEFAGSFVTLWMARENEPSELVVKWGPYNLSAGSPAENQRFGKVWLTPYNTGRSASHEHPVAYTWYDELIISRNRISDPGGNGAAARAPGEAVVEKP
jgi:hypothetical protein